MASEIGKYRVTADDFVTPELWNRVFSLVDARLTGLENAQANVDAVIDELVKIGLERINEVLLPAFQEIEELAHLGELLRASSSSAVTIGTGEATWIIDETQRQRFAAPLFVIAAVAGTTDQWMAGQVTGWDPETGALTVNVTNTRGSGEHSSWDISVAAIPPEVPPAQEAANVTFAPAGAIEAQDVQTAIEELDTEKADAAATQAALDAKASAGHGHAIDDIANLQAELDNKSDVGHIHDSLYAPLGHTHAISDVNGLQDALDNTGSAKGLFHKASPDAPAWTKTGNGTAESQTELTLEVNGSVITIASGTSISMPTLNAGTDYAIWATPAGALQADASFSTPPVSGARKVGGFHYAPGGNAAAQSGGDSTAQINEYSFWDLKWRPACEDPRGMACIAGGFWADIYLTGVDHHTGGTSAYNVTIADGSSPPKVPDAFGGNGSTTYGSYTWYEAAELLASHGKRPPTQAEFMALAYGVTEETDAGSDPGSTGLDAARTSKWGVMQATGNMWVWGNQHGGQVDDTAGRGESLYQPSAVLLGGNWHNGTDAGSRCSAWDSAPSSSDSGIGSRGVCDHLRLD